MLNNLIILRGPSGSGKSTVAYALQKNSCADILIIGQDYYRHTLLADKNDIKSIVPKMVYQDSLIALEAGYTVILEGIFRKEKYLPMFQNLVKEFRGKTYIYYFDISFGETVRRHATRDKAALFSAAEMKAWYFLAVPLGITGECRIPEDMTEEETVHLIRTQTNLS